MVAFLSSDSWQGIGVIVSIIIVVMGILLTPNIRRKVFRSKNSLFLENSNVPKELLEGQFTTLFGKEREKVFFGPPNYESINNGDKPHFYWILYVNSPINLVGWSMENGALYENGNSCMFQLNLMDAIYENRLDILGKYVKVDGISSLDIQGIIKLKQC
ncbi:hypothetical protein ACCW94_15395 [Enterobacter soli]|uniref:DUF4431 domain-containing protein n=1 Tax=Enterobacter soli TaxID=885040 RepID=UPI003ED8500B